MDVDPEELSAAVVTWIGRGRSSFPRPDEQRLVDAYGAERAAVLLPRVRALREAFNSSPAPYAESDLATLGDVATAEFRERHPEVSEEAVGALRWDFTYCNR